MPYVFINSENTMSVLDINYLEGHVCGTFHGILVATGRTEAAMAAEGNELEPATFGTAIHGTAMRGVATVNHFPNVFDLGGTGVEGIYYFFIMIGKYFLENIHKIIMV